MIRAYLVFAIPVAATLAAACSSTSSSTVPLTTPVAVQPEIFKPVDSTIDLSGIRLPGYLQLAKGSATPDIVAPPKKAPPELVFRRIGQTEELLVNQTVKIRYTDLDTSEIYLKGEPLEGGYLLAVELRHEKQKIRFTDICENFIVAHPKLTELDIPMHYRFEQIIWTPREEGTWEVRLGNGDRQCKDPSARLKRMRTAEYEKVAKPKKR